ncbi:MAG: hypothetical protein JO147_08190 [Actinobacteria bacterium]|nr:hypothetical protein [Actinomycetota bacterium]
MVRTKIYPKTSVIHPRSWRLIPVEAVSAGNATAVAYLTDQATVAQCSTASAPDHTTMICGPPVKVVGPHGVLITVVLVSLLWRAPLPPTVLLTVM